MFFKKNSYREEKNKKFKEIENQYGDNHELATSAKSLFLSSRAEFFITESKYDDAISDLTEALNLSPEAVDLYFSLASAYKVKNDLINAAKTLSACLKMIAASNNPETKIRLMDVHFMLGMLYLEIGDMQVVVNSFFLFLKEEVEITKNPIWKKTVEESNFVRQNILENNVDSNSIHVEMVKFAKETLNSIRDHLDEKTKGIVDEVL